MLMDRNLTNDEIRQRYGLEPYEWSNSLVDTMAAIVGKDMPDRDVYANALLRDGVKAFEREMELDEYEGRVDNELRDAISQATWGGVIIDDPTMIAIQDADDRYVLPVGAESLGRTYYDIHQFSQADDARLADLRLEMRFPQPTEDEIKQYYGLDSHEWTGSLADKVRTVINKNEPQRDDYVNALLRDGAIHTTEKIQYYESDYVRRGWLEPCVNDEGDKLYGAAIEAAWSGILIDDEAMAEISKIERDYVRPYGKSTMVQDYAQLHDLNNARAYHRQNVARERAERVSPQPTAAPKAPSLPEASIKGQRGPGQPVRVGDVAKQWMASMGRGADGRPLAPSSGSQKGSGTIQAALPGSSIKVGSAPRVPSTTRRMGAPAAQQARRDEASFEL